MTKNIQEKYSQLMFTLVLSFIILFMSSSVSAAGCCTVDTSGNLCTQTDSSKCASGEIFAEGISCSATPFCQVGCCYDSSTGIYDSGVLESSCNSDWSSDPFCNVPGSDLGCCVLGDTTSFQTQRACEISTERAGISNPDWRRDVKEDACLLIPYAGDQGACILNDKSCTFGSRESCTLISGEFSLGNLCTASSLNSTCEKTPETTCVEGLDEVYFLDSCGNIANVYDSSKTSDQSYWEQKVEPSASCNSDLSNANSKSCGNCDKFQGSRCSVASESNFEPDSGDAYCKDTTCEYNGTIYNSGDSWCNYDGATGINDVVGSRHWQFSCNQGTVDSVGCEDYRNQICIQSNTEENGEIVKRNAECVVNTWRQCLSVNGEFKGSKRRDECEKLVNCRMEDVSIDSKFKFKNCVPKYPGGFNIREESSAEESEDVCKLASKTCKITRKRKITGSCKIRDNGNCRGSDFTVSMNEFCRGLGDCGGSVNIAGEYQSSYRVSGAPKLKRSVISRLISYATPVPGQYAIVDQNYDAFLAAIGIDPSEATRLNASRAGRLNSHFSKGVYAISTGLIANLFSSTDSIASSVWGSCSSRYAKFTCEPWQPPRGGDDCELCNGDPLKPCSEYRCNSLGAGCELINTESGNPQDFLCLNTCGNDTQAPIISPNYDALSIGSEYTDVSSSGFTLTKTGEACLQPFIPTSFGIVTNEPSVCRFDFEPSDYEDMNESFGNIFRYNHSTVFSLPDPSQGQSQGGNWTGDITLYVKCQDKCGHETSTFYSINMCVYEGPDIFGPLITTFTPENDSFVSISTLQAPLNITTNELSTCKWDLTEKEYGDMNNNFECNDELGDRSSAFGYLCTTSLPLNEAKNTFHIKCADQPWLIGTANESNRNVGSNTLTLNKPEEKISIDWILPDTLITSPTNEVTVELQIKTSNGANFHQCFWSLKEDKAKVPMFPPTSENIHTQVGLQLYDGNWEIFVECRDETGDTVNSKTSFEIRRDVTPPLIARVWQESSQIFFITTENAECKYSEQSCNFEWANGTDIGSSRVHSIDSTIGKKYYVKCQDGFENIPQSCSIILQATN